MVDYLLGAGPVLLGVLIILTEVLKWPRKLNLAWGSVAILFGIGVALLF